MNIYKYYKNYLFKNELKKIDFINSKKSAFESLFYNEESEDEYEEEKEEEE